MSKICFKAKLSQLLKVINAENSTPSISLGPVNVNVSASTKHMITPTRIGINIFDKTTPFVEDDINKLINFYHAYKGCKEYSFSQSPYVDTIPLRLGKKGFSYGKDVNDYVIDIVDAEFTIADRLLRHSDAAINLFKDIKKIRFERETNSWENNLSMRIAKWDQDSNTIKVQPAYYFDQVSTNLTLDWASGKINDKYIDTIRNDIEMPINGRLPKLESSILANTLGVAAFFVSEDHQDILIPIRGEEQAIMSGVGGKFHCSSSGVFEWPARYRSERRVRFDMFLEGMKKEIKDELNLSEDLYELAPLAFSRELVRGGKPQLFFVAESKIDINEIQNLMRSAKERWEFIFQENLPDNSSLKPYLRNTEDAPQNFYTYEGWMGMKILAAFINKSEPPFPII